MNKMGYAAEQDYKGKLRKYSKSKFDKHTLFKPFIMEEFGLMEKESKLIFDHLCDVISNRNNKPADRVKFYYSKRFSIALQRTSSQMVIDRCNIYDYSNNLSQYWYCR